MKLYSITREGIYNDLLESEVAPKEIEQIIAEIYSNVGMGMIPGATVVNDSIVGDAFAAIRFAINEDFAMKEININDIEVNEIDLYKLYNKDKVAEYNKKFEGILQ